MVEVVHRLHVGVKADDAQKEQALIDLPLCFLFAFGHCGIDWLHSLLDSHPQVLIMPALSFYRSWKLLGCDNIKDPKEMVVIWERHIEKLCESKKLSKMLFHSKAEKDRFYPRFQRLIERGELTRIDLFWALHEAYAFAKDIDSTGLRIVVAQEHLPHHFQQALADFPRAHILQIIRDPRATFAGTWKLNSRKNSFLAETDFSQSIINWLHAYKNYKIYKPKLGNRYRIVRNEDLHQSLEPEMRRLAGWMGINFSPILLKPTFCGKRWGGESAYMGSDNRYPVPEGVFYLLENVKKRWLKELSRSEILMIESLTWKSMKKFNYSLMTGNGLIWRAYGFIAYLLPRRGLFRAWVRSYETIKRKKFNPNREGTIFNGKLDSILWNYSPGPIRFLLVILNSIAERILNYLFPVKRAQRYH